MTKVARRSEARSKSGAGPEGGAASTPSLRGRERIRKLLQAEIDKLDPLEDTRRAAALIGENSIRITDEPAAPGFVIVGRDGQPRTAVRDGRPAPFTLADLAAEVRDSYPALFKPATSPETPVAPDEPQAVSAPRDWLVVDGAPPAPRIETAAPEEAQAEASGQRRIAVSQGRSDAEPSGRSPGAWGRIRALGSGWRRAPIVGRLAGLLRPRFAIYAILVFSIVIASSFVVSRSGSNGGKGGASDRQAASVSRTVPTAAIPPASAEVASTSSTPPLTVAGIPDVIDTTTLRVDKRIVRLFGVEWQRGAQAADLTRYIGGRQVVCAPTAGSDRYSCKIEGRDLSEVILYNGGARATGEATPELKAAEEKARASGIGVWKKP